jgi:hypothetical protein
MKRCLVADSRLNLHGMFSKCYSAFDSLDIKSLAALREVDRELNSLATQPFLKIAASQLLQYIKKADWKNIKRIVVACPAAMFYTARIQLFGEYIKINPIEFAAYLKDIHTVLIFKDAVHSDDEKLFISDINKYLRFNESKDVAGKSEYIELISGWFYGNDTITIEHIREYICRKTLALSNDNASYSQQPYQWVTEGYALLLGNTKKAARRGENVDASVELLNAYLKKVHGYSACHVLPRHKLLRMLAVRHENGNEVDKLWDMFCWRPEANFNEAETPTVMQAIRDTRVASGVKMHPLSTDSPDDILGEHFTIVCNYSRPHVVDKPYGIDDLEEYELLNLQTLQRQESVLCEQFTRLVNSQPVFNKDETYSQQCTIC